MTKLSKKAKAFFCALLLLLLINFIAGTAQAAETITWSFTTVDKGVVDTDDNGKYLSLYYDSGSELFTMSWYDETNSSLRYGECYASTDCSNSANWTKTTVDNSADVGLFTSINRKMISYYDATNKNLKLAWYYGGGLGNCTDNNWFCMTVDGSANNDVGEYTSLTRDPQIGMSQCGNRGAAISYYDATNGALKYAQKVTDDPPECDDYVIETVDNNTNNAFDGQYTSIEWNTSNYRPTISSYSENPSGDGFLRYAEKVGGAGGDCTNTAWECTTVSTAAGKKYGQHTSLAGYDDKGVWMPGISHYDGVDNNLRFAYFDSVNWNDTLIDANGTVGEWTSLAYQTDVWTNGGPWHISYYDATSKLLKYANGQVADGNCDDTGGAPDWDCYKTNTPSPDSGTNYGLYTSIVVPAASNQIAIGYYNTENNGDAKIALGKGPEPQQPAIPEFKNYWYIAIAAVAALALFFVVRSQFEKKK